MELSTDSFCSFNDSGVQQTHTNDITKSSALLHSVLFRIIWIHKSITELLYQSLSHHSNHIQQISCFESFLIYQNQYDNHMNLFDKEWEWISSECFNCCRMHKWLMLSSFQVCYWTNDDLLIVQSHHWIQSREYHYHSSFILFVLSILWCWTMKGTLVKWIKNKRSTRVSEWSVMTIGWYLKWYLRHHSCVNNDLDNTIYWLE